jgi:hypothetical protein
VVQNGFNINFSFVKKTSNIYDQTYYSRDIIQKWIYGAVIKDYNSLGTQNKPLTQRNQWLAIPPTCFVVTHPHPNMMSQNIGKPSLDQKRG